jgi:pSer/pThr/pTyr-binding forkhead associated (FHA) protein
MPARLTAVDEGPDIVLDRDTVVVGRHPSCDVRLESLRVSRRHCCVTQENGEVTVRDLGSMNGTRINGQKVEVGLLRRGDELTIAHYRYRLEDDDDDFGMPAALPPELGDPITWKAASTVYNWPRTKRPRF